MRPRATGGAAAGLLLAAVVLYALNLRGPIVAVAPIVQEVASGLGISVAAAGVFSSIPVVLFATATPFAAFLMRRASLETTVLLSLAVVALGTVVRSLGDFAWAVTGTVVIGAAIAVGNVVVPVIVRRDFRGREGVVNGIYTASLNAGSVLTTALTAPLADLVGWRWALASWALLTLVAAAVWWRVRDLALPGRSSGASLVGGAPRGHDAEATDGRGAAEGTPAGPSVPAEPSRTVWRRVDVWLLVAAMGGQSFSYYSLSAWLPTLLADTVGLDANGAGVASSAFQALAVVGAIGAPVLMAKGVSTRVVLVGLAVLWVALPVGLLAAPGANVVWMSCAGVAQGGNFTVLITIMARRARDGREMQRMSAFVQGCGYGIAATGPTLLGLVHTASGGWTVPLVVVLGALTVMAVAGLVVASARPVPPRPV
ncbi:CP family cyanate transporter-like MFS transporter [Flavimobilis soli]|uniref:CP family cyanate transporter-like MFS transporter n=1 Tax=Flavimobilis soli TaxID=442709 RepID=A0A2A9EF75_9MICO|nr:MFS transporter [Flavimobilis soli]PFG37286.1 CP family cyanate transporter-like MFS transporter [Flavimobilis soli]